MRALLCISDELLFDCRPIQKSTPLNTERNVRVTLVRVFVGAQARVRASGRKACVVGWIGGKVGRHGDGRRPRKDGDRLDDDHVAGLRGAC